MNIMKKIFVSVFMVFTLLVTSVSAFAEEAYVVVPKPDKTIVDVDLTNLTAETKPDYLTVALGADSDGKATVGQWNQGFSVIGSRGVLRDIRKHTASPDSDVVEIGFSAAVKQNRIMAFFGDGDFTGRIDSSITPTEGKNGAMSADNNYGLLLDQEAKKITLFRMGKDEVTEQLGEKETVTFSSSGADNLKIRIKPNETVGNIEVYQGEEMLFTANDNAPITAGCIGFKFEYAGASTVGGYYMKELYDDTHESDFVLDKHFDSGVDTLADLQAEGWSYYPQEKAAINGGLDFGEHGRSYLRFDKAFGGSYHIYAKEYDPYTNGQGIAFSADKDCQNYYLLSLKECPDGSNGTEVQLYKCVNGTKTPLGISASVSEFKGGDFEYEISVDTQEAGKVKITGTIKRDGAICGSMVEWTDENDPLTEGYIILGDPATVGATWNGWYRGRRVVKQFKVYGANPDKTMTVDYEVDGEAATDYDKGKISATIPTLVLGEKGYTVISALYQKAENRLLEAKMFTGEQMKEGVALFDTTYAEEDLYVRTFIWDSLEKMYPLTSTFDLK
ncbi:hypothetical protein [Ructibacterium gallinarum]|uniref:Uncharacterized protein n=1 Tax=Ructibacterium gallinarum TaxID=2779355 RepID=A0A9D5R9H8_9FIRM|nr:hypothetical protein [Ructibacterium gallinarum]MBE5040509.1 hypothetical protein [Ructibacterium gallinarum]